MHCLAYWNSYNRRLYLYDIHLFEIGNLFSSHIEQGISELGRTDAAPISEQSPIFG